MPERHGSHLDEDIAQSRKELLRIAELYLAHGMTEKAQEVMALVHQMEGASSQSAHIDAQSES